MKLSLSSTIVACLLAPALPALAQEKLSVVTAFAQLDPRLFVDRTVYVQTAKVTRDQRGYGIKGKVLKVSASTLWLQVKGKVREFPASDVLVISERHSGGRVGALVGFAVGMGSALILSGAGSEGGLDSEVAGLAMCVLGGLGTFSGWQVGREITDDRILFLAPDLAPSRAVVLTPVVNRRAAGLAATFRF
jgi:hypothetical protein